MRVGDLLCKGRLALPVAPPCHEEMAIHVGAKARQYVTAIPSKPAGNLVRDLTHNVLPLGLGVSGGNVKEQLTPRTIWFAEVVLPAQRTQILRPQRQGEHDINRNRNLGFDEPNAAPLKILCDFRRSAAREENRAWREARSDSNCRNRVLFFAVRSNGTAGRLPARRLSSPISFDVAPVWYWATWIRVLAKPMTKALGSRLAWLW